MLLFTPKIRTAIWELPSLHPQLYFLFPDSHTCLAQQWHPSASSCDFSFYSESISAQTLWGLAFSSPPVRPWSSIPQSLLFSLWPPPPYISFTQLLPIHYSCGPTSLSYCSHHSATLYRPDTSYSISSNCYDKCMTNLISFTSIPKNGLAHFFPNYLSFFFRIFSEFQCRLCTFLP